MSKNIVIPTVIVVYGNLSLQRSALTGKEKWVSRLRRSFEIYRVFYDLRNFCVYRRLQFGLAGALTVIFMAVPANNAVAQFPGVGSEAPSGVATAADEDVSSNIANADMSTSEANNYDSGNSALNSLSDVSGQLNDDGGSYSNLSPSRGTSNLTFKKKYDRKQLFVKKLRLEFAAIELVERKTGLPFSRSDIPRYLDELRSDLKTMVVRAENGEIVEGALKSIVNDAGFIETKLNDHLEQLLEHAGQPFPKKPFFASMLSLPKGDLKSGAGIDKLSLKFELAEYGEKALQAMGARRN